MAGAFSSALHPRAGAGRFTTTVGGVQLPPLLAQIYQRYAGSTTLGFNGRSGTGYGSAGGDARVSYVQRLLNRLGFGDASGRPLAVDGKLGPRTTEAVKAAQRKVGVKPDGQVTPALVAQLLKLPTPKGAGHGHRGGGHHATKRARHLMSRKHH